MRTSNDKPEYFTARFCWIAILPLFILLSACSRPTLPDTPLQPVSTNTPSPTIKPTTANTATPTPPQVDSTMEAYLNTEPSWATQCNPFNVELSKSYKTPTPTSPPEAKPTYTPSPTAGSAMTLPLITPRAIGTPYTAASIAISEENYQNLANVAVWGKGNISGVAYIPDGSGFIVGSSYGIAIYASTDPSSPPRWVPFGNPFNYDDLFISRDGNYLLLVKYHYSFRGDSVVRQVRKITDGTIADPLPEGVEWIKDDQQFDDANQVYSIDGNLRLKVHGKRDENNWVTIFFQRYIFDNPSSYLISSLTDESTYVYYEDRSSPEGCDISSFSYCGNVYDPSAMEPYRAGFSPSGKTLAIMYRPGALYHNERYSTLRLYNVSDGSFITQIGSFAQPVQSFGYSPDGNSLLIGYVNGSIQLWDIPANKETFTAWHFNASIDYLSYSYDGRYLLVQRMSMLEVRFTSDGALNGRYTSSVFATSPVANLVAIADDQGQISVNDISSGRALYQIQAHDGPVYSLAFSPDGQTLVSSGEDCDVRAWEVATGASLHRFEETTVNAYGEEFTASRIFIYYTRFIPGTKTLIGFGSWGTTVAWNIESGARQYVVESAPLEYYQGMVTLNPHFPESFAVDTTNNLFYIDNNGYNINTGAFVGPYQFPEDVPYGCSLAGPRTRDGNLLFTVGIDNLEGRICILDAQDYSYLGSIQVISYQPDNYIYINWLYLSPDGKQLIVTTESGVFYVYQIAH